MWLQLRLYLLIALLFSILYGIIIGLGYLLGLQGSTFYLFILVFAFLLVFIQYLIGPKTVEWSMHVKYIKPNQYPKIHEMIQRLSEKAGLPNPPKIGISQIQIPNAFAFGRTRKDARVCITEGILHLLDEKELEAVLGHEISHIKHRDVAVITLLSVVPMICYMLYITFFWGGMFNRRRDGSWMILIGFVALFLYFITNSFLLFITHSSLLFS